MPFGITSNGPPRYGSADRRAASETAMNRSTRSAAIPQSLLPIGYQPSRSPAACTVATVGQSATISANGGQDGRERLVHVDDVEALLREDPLHPQHRRRREDDVREGGVGRHDHRAPDRENVVRRRGVPSFLGVEELRQPPGRVVPDDQLGVDAEARQRAGLVVGVLQDAAPERPRVRDDDPHFHGGNIPA